MARWPTFTVQRPIPVPNTTLKNVNLLRWLPLAVPPLTSFLTSLPNTVKRLRWPNSKRLRLRFWRAWRRLYLPMHQRANLAGQSLEVFSVLAVWVAPGLHSVIGKIALMYLAVLFVFARSFLSASSVVLKRENAEFLKHVGYSQRFLSVIRGRYHKAGKHLGSCVVKRRRQYAYLQVEAAADPKHCDSQIMVGEILACLLFLQECNGQLLRRAHALFKLLKPWYDDHVEMGEDASYSIVKQLYQIFKTMDKLDQGANLLSSNPPHREGKQAEQNNQLRPLSSDWTGHCNIARSLHVEVQEMMGHNTADESNDENFTRKARRRTWRLNVRKALEGQELRSQDNRFAARNAQNAANGRRRERLLSLTFIIL